MSLLKQFVVLHVLLIHIIIMISISISCTWLEVHILILEIDDVQVVVLVDNLVLLSRNTWTVIGAFASFVSTVASFVIFYFEAFFV